MMSSHPTRRDPGMTLIELLVSVLVIGSIATVLAATLTVTFRQQGDTQGRLDVARWGQSLAMWLPTDIASADTSVPSNVSVDPLAAPCASAECTFGSNALQLKWDDGTGQTTVSYRYGPAADGTSFILTRVECKGGVCSSRVVLRDLSGPVDDDGNPLPWTAGQAVPGEVIDVTVPIAVLSSDPLDLDNDSTAQRVIVNVNGAPGVDGTDRSASVSFTAGGSSFDTIDPTTYERPRFLQANSGCGGPVTLIVDESASLSSTDMDNVKLGVRSFIKAFEGTPTQLQIVTFHTQSRTLGSGSDWNKFFDLAEPDDVLALMGPTGTTGLVSTIAIGTGTGQGGTNWEDALHRTFYSRNGQSYQALGDPNAPPSELVVFFTDGVPTFDRQHAKSDTSSVGPASIPSQFTYDTANTPGKSYGNDFTPRGWYRADYIVEPFRNVEGFNFIGVGVGPAFNLNTRVYRNGWPGPTSTPNPIPNAAFLGDLIVNGNPDRNGETGQSGYAVTLDVRSSRRMGRRRQRRPARDQRFHSVRQRPDRDRTRQLRRYLDRPDPRRGRRPSRCQDHLPGRFQRLCEDRHDVAHCQGRHLRHSALRGRQRRSRAHSAAVRQHRQDGTGVDVQGWWGRPPRY